MSLTNWGAMPAPASKVEECMSVLSVAQNALEGTLRCLLHCLLGVIVFGIFLQAAVGSMIDTLWVGTWKAMTVSFTFSSGVTLFIALAVSVERKSKR